jgi:hypothetical protein
MPSLKVEKYYPLSATLSITFIRAKTKFLNKAGLSTGIIPYSRKAGLYIWPTQGRPLPLANQ